MLSFEHKNVMCLIGVCIDGEMPLLIMPFMSNGSVLEFLKHHKNELLCCNASQAMVLSSSFTTVSLLPNSPYYNVYFDVSINYTDC